MGNSLTDACYTSNSLFLPDKEFRYLRTIIVIAATHQRFGKPREGIPLTFWRWAGVSPYTSAYAFAETCVFGKQSPGLFRCGSATLGTNSLTEKFLILFASSQQVVLLILVQELQSAVSAQCGGPGLIPKLRPLYCRVP